ncbi:JAB domain-containing protein [Mycobacterium hubeiense]|uniref:JAB domain-containing protein n=1 Tax=Mycobacterium hubeiense TaxID=1867256 RepID=UPI000C7F3222|nr:DNA repair protein RadC [Mycobacterium sp. QGD 101]
MSTTPDRQLRDRLQMVGATDLADHELLALVLQSGTRKATALDLAAQVLNESGGLHWLAHALPEELSARTGISPAQAAAIAAAFILARRSNDTAAPTTLRNSHDIARAAATHLAGARRERVLVLVCDGANRLKRTIVVSEGAVDASLFPVREIFNAVRRHDGRAFALAHNHPSGQLDPSDADRRATDQIRAASNVVGLRFLDHVIIAANQWRSLTDTNRATTTPTAQKLQPNDQYTPHVAQ